MVMGIRVYLALLLLFWSVLAPAETLRVGIKAVPPFAMPDGQDGWTGISVELWQRIAVDLGWQTEWVVMDSSRAQIKALETGSIDVALGALSMTREREAVMDFSAPFYATHLAIATPAQYSNWRGVLKELLSPAFLRTVAVLLLLLVAVGGLLWLVERKRNPQEFGGSVMQGIGSGFWWSLVTMTTVGYGDKAPATFIGRLLATIWMFASIIMIAGLTASIAASLTVNQLNTTVRSVQDLNQVRSVAVSGSTGEQYLRKNGIRMQLVTTAAEGLMLLREGDAEALIYDEALLRYLLKDAAPGIEILRQSIQMEYYAFGMKSSFVHEEKLNQTLLAYTSDSQWKEILNRYLGQH
jgi:ABC-type amino acid transport substrate-binding protein|tara:strand:+ start:209 stop:1267 length:1059 start_codon:yes stop_codon:yes gene_type:complete